MAQSFSIKAVLEAVDKNFTSSLDRAYNMMGKLGNASGSMSGKVGKSNGEMVGTFTSVAGAMGLVEVASRAFDVIKASVGSAVSRIDTLNNSKRTFANMGFSANQTKDAMKGLETSIKGLPTPLDQAVKGVQMISASTGNLGKSQQVWSALNDAIIGFGGSTEDVNNATIQLSQAFSNGKIDGQTWISMMNSGMGPALNAIAKQMGITTGALKEGLSSGKISTDQFMDALISLDKNGGGGLKSLHQIAKDSTDGIQTSMENAKTAITRGVATAVLAFSDFAKKVTGMNLSEIITAIGNAVETGLSKVGPVLQQVTPFFKTLYDTVKGLFDFVLSNSDIFGPIAVGVMTFIGAFKGVSMAISGLQGIISTGKNLITFVQIIGQAKNAFSAFSVLLGLNPMVLIIAGIVAVVAALTWFFTQTKTGQQIWQTFTTFLTDLWNGLVEIAQTIWNAIVQAVQPIVSTIMNLWNSFADFFSALWAKIGPIVTAVWQGIVTYLQTVWENIKIIVSTVINIVQTIISTGLSIISTIFSTVWNVIETVVKTVWNVIVTVISTTINVIAGIIKAITQVISGDWNGAWNTIQNIISTVWNAIKSIVTSIINMVKSVILSVMNAIKSIIMTVWNAVKSVTSSVWNGIKSVVSNAINIIRNTVTNIMNGIRSIFSSGWNLVKSVTSSGINGAADIVKKIAGNMISAGRNFVMGFVRGITRAIGSAVKAAANLAKKALSAAKSVLGIHSPSRVMRDEVGYYVTEGMAVGILGNIKSVVGAVDKVADASIIDIPKPNTNEFMDSIKNLGNMQNRFTGGIYAGNLTGELSLSAQPAYINLNLGNSNYSTFVDDISKQQGIDAEFKRTYRI